MSAHRGSTKYIDVHSYGCFAQGGPHMCICNVTDYTEIYIMVSFLKLHVTHGNVMLSNIIFPERKSLISSKFIYTYMYVF